MSRLVFGAGVGELTALSGPDPYGDRYMTRRCGGEKDGDMRNDTLVQFQDTPGLAELGKKVLTAGHEGDQ